MALAASTALHVIAAMARQVLHPCIAIGISDPRTPTSAPLPAEQPATGGMTQKRLLEFAAGRHAARQAMITLGVPPQPVPMGPDRAPVWPGDLTGSISHCETACLAALAKTSDCTMLGVDLELDTPLPDDLTRTICTGCETAWLQTQPPSHRARLAKLIFSAKECTYKAQYPLTGQLFGFETLIIEPDLSQNSFSATFAEPIGCFPAGPRISGQFSIRSGVILTGIYLLKGT